MEDFRLSWFGHQSLFDRIPIFVAPCTTGHLPALSAFMSIFCLLRGVGERSAGPDRSPGTRGSRVCLESCQFGMIKSNHIATLRR